MNSEEILKFGLAGLVVYLLIKVVSGNGSQSGDNGLIDKLLGPLSKPVEMIANSPIGKFPPFNILKMVT